MRNPKASDVEHTVALLLGGGIDGGNAANDETAVVTDDTLEAVCLTFRVVSSRSRHRKLAELLGQILRATATAHLR